jgi:hypothetical protein
MLIAGCIIPVADPGASIPRLVASKCRKNRHISTALPLSGTLLAKRCNVTAAVYIYRVLLSDPVTGFTHSPHP